MKYKLLGYSIISSVFIVLYIFIWIQHGFLKALLAYGITIVITLIILLGVYFITKDD